MLQKRMTQPFLFDVSPTLTPDRTWFSELLAGFGVNENTGWPDQFGAALRRWAHLSQHRSPRALSLFAGGGGLDIAFHDLGFEIVEAIEIERKYAQTLSANASEGGLLAGSKVMCLDIQAYHPEPSLNIDFILGGPPCQTYSAAGRRAAGVSGTSDPRGILFEDYVRILKTLRPRGFLFENVYGLTGAQSGQAWQEIQDAFRSAGYAIQHRILDAADYGVPQHRERLFIVGLRDGEAAFRFPAPTHGPDSEGQQAYYSAAEAVAGATTQDAVRGLGGRYGRLLTDIPPGLNYSFYTQELGHPYPVFSWRSKFSDFLYKADPDKPVRTLKAQGGQYTGPFSWENRPFTVAELKRLQTFPDAYQLIGGKQVAIRQLGNSVPPQMGRMLALAVLDQLTPLTLPIAMRYLAQDQQLGFRQRKRALTQHYAKRAKEALAQLEATQQLRPYFAEEFAEGEVSRFLGSDFAWSDSPSPGTELRIDYALENDNWLIRATRAQITTASVYEITLTPLPQFPWVLEAERIRLVAADDSPKTFMALWKALEERLLAVTGNADLVQLSGYYQYEPRVKIKLEYEGKKSIFKLDLQPGEEIEQFSSVLCFVLQGIGVASQLSISLFAQLWQCSERQVLPCLLILRQLGYEVRGHNTNPQISDGKYLIPYAFPTLTPRSVQLHKSLLV